MVRFGVLAMGLVVAFHFKLKMAFFPLAIGVSSIWACLFFVRKWPSKAERIIGTMAVPAIKSHLATIEMLMAMRG